MLPAIIDYICYRSGVGRYARRQYHGSFAGNDLSLLPTALQKGDLLFIATPNSVLSWLVMYVSNSRFSHVALYVGDGRIAHMTLSGFAIESFASLASMRCRVVPFIMNVDPEKRAKLDLHLQKYKDEPYGWIPVTAKSLRIFFARDVPNFRFRFIADFLGVLGVFDLIAWPVLGHAVFLWLTVPYLLLIGYNVRAFVKGPNNFDFLTPRHLYLWARAGAARALINMGGVEPGPGPPLIPIELYVWFDGKPPSADELRSAMNELGVVCNSSLEVGVNWSVVHLELPPKVRGRCKAIIVRADTAAEWLSLVGPAERRSCLCVKGDVEVPNIGAAIGVSCAFAKASNGDLYNPLTREMRSSDQVIQLGRDWLQHLSDINADVLKRRCHSGGAVSPPS